MFIIVFTSEKFLCKKSTVYCSNLGSFLKTNGALKICLYIFRVPKHQCGIRSKPAGQPGSQTRLAPQSWEVVAH